MERPAIRGQNPTRRTRTKMDYNNDSCCKFCRAAGRHELKPRPKENIDPRSSQTLQDSGDTLPNLLQSKKTTFIVSQGNDDPKYSDKEKAQLTGEDVESFLTWLLLACHLYQDSRNTLIFKTFFHEGRDSTDFLVVYPHYRTIISIESKRTYADGSIEKAGQQHEKLKNFLEKCYTLCKVTESWELVKISCFWLGDAKKNEDDACFKRNQEWINVGQFKFADQVNKALESKEKCSLTQAEVNFLTTVFKTTLTRTLTPVEIVKQDKNGKVGRVVEKLLNDTRFALKKLSESQRKTFEKDMQDSCAYLNL